MKIGILQTGHLPDDMRAAHGDYAAMFANLFDGRGYSYVVFNVVDMEFPDSLDAADAWLVTGSKHGVYEDHAFIAPLEDLLRAIRDKGAPLVGICFGHQIIAQAFGGHVEKFAGGWCVGRQDYEINGEKLHLNAWHQDQVITLPEGAQTLGSSDFCAHAAIAYGERILTVQPHPEFQAPVVNHLIETRGRGVVPDDLLAKAEEGLAHATQNERLADMLAAVLDKAQVPA